MGCLCSELVELDLIMIFVAVPEGVVARDRVSAVVVDLVDAGSGEPVAADTAGHPGRVVDIVAGTGAERGEQRGFGLEIVLVGAGSVEHCLLQSNVVGQGIVDAVFERPPLGVCGQWCRHDEDGHHSEFDASVHNHLAVSFYLCIVGFVFIIDDYEGQ